jgi:hypothetical protein
VIDGAISGNMNYGAYIASLGFSEGGLLDTWSMLEKTGWDTMSEGIGFLAQQGAANTKFNNKSN